MMPKLLTALLALTLIAGSAFALELKQSSLTQQFELGVRSSASLTAFSQGVSEEDDTWIDGGEEEPSDVDDEALSGRKSPLKAGLLSALVPGLGQVYNDQFYKARYFIGAEALTWVGFVSFRMYGDWREDDAIQFANTNANARLDDKSDEFRDWVGFYTNTEEYNSFGRVGDPDRPYFAPDDPDYHWQWQSEEDRRTYRDLRNSSKESYRRADFMIYVALINRTLSVIEAVYSANKINSVVDEGWEFGGIRYKLDIDPMSNDRQVSLTVYPGF